MSKKMENECWVIQKSTATNVNSITKFSVKCTIKQIALRMKEDEKKNHTIERSYAAKSFTRRIFPPLAMWSSIKNIITFECVCVVNTSCSQAFKSKLQLSHFVRFSHIHSPCESRWRWRSHLHVIKCTGNDLWTKTRASERERKKGATCMCKEMLYKTTSDVDRNRILPCEDKEIYWLISQMNGEKRRSKIVLSNCGLRFCTACMFSTNYLFRISSKILTNVFTASEDMTCSCHGVSLKSSNRILVTDTRCINSSHISYFVCVCIWIISCSSFPTKASTLFIKQLRKFLGLFSFHRQPFATGFAATP